MESGLGPRQQRFVQEYLVDLNATQAAKRAGYEFPKREGLRLLKRVAVREALVVAQEALTRRLMRPAR